VGSWYWIGVSVGLGAAVGVLRAALLGFRFLGGFRKGVLGAVLSGVLLGLVLHSTLPGSWIDLATTPAGAVLAFVGVAQVVAGALRRGGTRGGTAVLVAGAAVVVAGIAFIPVAGYLEPLALPALAARLRRTQPERYAGLRTLARD
jgi:hypothetical protein